MKTIKIPAESYEGKKIKALAAQNNVNPDTLLTGLLYAILSDADEPTAPAPAEPPVIEAPEPPTLPKWKAPAQEPEFDINSVTFSECIPTLPQ